MWNISTQFITIFLYMSTKSCYCPYYKIGKHKTKSIVTQLTSQSKFWFKNLYIFIRHDTYEKCMSIYYVFFSKEKPHTKSLFPLIVSRCFFSSLYLLSSKRIPNKTLAFFRSCSSLQRHECQGFICSWTSFLITFLFQFKIS